MSETGRELLELAAKAAGYELALPASPDMRWIEQSNEFVAWNPLEDDGDALRLACKLGIDIFPWQNKTQDQRTIGIEAAARRAIVRAAAEIGKSM